MLIEAVKFVGSTAKWGKMWVLLREQLTSALFLIRSAKDDPASNPKTQLPTGSVATQNAITWSYTSRLDLPEALTKDTYGRFKQDQLLTNGTVETTLDYRFAVFEDATIYSNGATHVSVFDEKNQRVPEFSYSKFSRFIPTVRRIPIQRCLSGTSLSLYGNVENTSGNIGHWMIDGISRLFLATQHYTLHEIDHVLVPKLKYGFQRESLLALGLNADQIVEIDTLECVRCERLIVTTAPRGYSSSITPGWMIDAYRSIMLPENTEVNSGKRIYISRRDAGSRKFTNEEELIKCLEAYGFVSVEMSAFSFHQKIALFSQAEIIVGLTGAGLTNLLFCRSSASVLELFPASFVTYFYASMCSYLGHDYDYLIVENTSSMSKMNRYYGNLSLDLHQLRSKVDAVLERRGESS